jgi:aminocarboxymuconate-semialdehyde decarboxylase
LIIDTHSHFYGETLFRHMEARGAVPRVERDGRRRFIVTPTSRFELTGGFVSLADRLAWMDGQGIGRQLITFPGALGPDVLPIAESLHLVRDVNDELAATCAAHPDRFLALCGLPLADMAASAAELQRSVRSLGLLGAILPSNYFLTLAGIDTLRPVLEAANDVGAHLMLHPGQRHDESLEPKRYADLGMHRASTIDLHGSITHALLSLLHSDAMTRYPNITWQVVNLGGSFPFLLERMDHIAATRDASAPLPSSLLGQVVYDCASLGPRALEMAVAVFGAERVMFGTDYPIFTSTVSSGALRDARITEAERAQVASGTALSVFARNAGLRGGITPSAPPIAAPAAGTAATTPGTPRNTSPTR